MESLNEQPGLVLGTESECDGFGGRGSASADRMTRPEIPDGHKETNP